MYYIEVSLRDARSSLQKDSLFRAILSFQKPESLKKSANNSTAQFLPEVAAKLYQPISWRPDKLDRVPPLHQQISPDIYSSKQTTNNYILASPRIQASHAKTVVPCSDNYLQDNRRLAVNQWLESLSRNMLLL